MNEHLPYPVTFFGYVYLMPDMFDKNLKKKYGKLNTNRYSITTKIISEIGSKSSDST